MKKIALVATFFVAMTIKSLAFITIEKVPCPTPQDPNRICTQIRWGKGPAAKGTLTPNSGKIEGDKLVLLFNDTRKISKSELENLIKNGIDLNGLTTISNDELVALGITNLSDKKVSVTNPKGTVVAKSKRDWPPITITITIKIGK